MDSAPKKIINLIGRYYSNVLGPFKFAHYYYILLTPFIIVKLNKIKGRAGHVTFIRDGKFNIYGGYNDDGLLLDFAQVDYSKYTCKIINIISLMDCIK